MKKRQVKCLGKDIYMLNDKKESYEELSKVCFKKLIEKISSNLTLGVEVI
jgi:hypothetical protein